MEMELKYILTKLINYKFHIKWVFLTLGIMILGLLYSLSVLADDNHVHVDQVNGGDNFEFTVDQYGYNNLIRFSFDQFDGPNNFSQVLAFLFEPVARLYSTQNTKKG